MEDRMLKDIGLSRSDVLSRIRGHKFWRHMLQPEESDKTCDSRREKESIQIAEQRDHCSSDFCLCSSDRSFSRN